MCCCSSRQSDLNSQDTHEKSQPVYGHLPLHLVGFYVGDFETELAERVNIGF